MPVRNRGFTLVEVLVAIGIVGIILLLLLAVVRAGATVRVDKGQGIALAIARNELESLRAGGYAALPVSGSFSDTLLGTLPGAVAALTVSPYDAKTKQVVVSVTWRDASLTVSSTVSLSTLITEIGGLP